MAKPRGTLRSSGNKLTVSRGASHFKKLPLQELDVSKRQRLASAAVYLSLTKE